MTLPARQLTGRSAFPVLLPTAILGVPLLLSVILITPLLFMPALPAQLRHSVGLLSLTPETSIMGGGLAVSLVAGIAMVASWLGSKRLAHVLVQE
ncbi:hypothetical protein [Thermogemmatispora carboxidivorans]|uniref:hypothetical protein n=1 Tax=Thermogemmatispora carboxidivorans TaxID=1382306 RepID=UPI00069BB521|nr:hypothetical protein [Thermogemmatispora carboxidivorans]